MFAYTSLQSSLFASLPICFALTDRLGGVSSAPHESLNLGYHVGDSVDSVRANHAQVRREFSQIFDVTPSVLHYLTQIHGTKILRLDEDLLSDSESICVGEADGILTNTPYKTALVMVADCNPILLYDRAKHVMALIHAGRKGVLEGIVPHAFDSMSRIYGSKPENCLVYIGASIRGCCYEVGEEVKSQVLDSEFSEALKEGVTDENLGGNHAFNAKLDLIHCLQIQFRTLGILPQHIEIDPHCTYCTGYFYSYRRALYHSGGRTGRFGLIAMLRA